MSDESPIESELRRSLAAHAFDAPDADDLTRRILEGPRRPVLDERSGRGPWRTWGLPLVAAAAVAAVVGAGALVASLDGGNGHRHDAATNAATNAATGSHATSTPSPRATSASPTTTGVSTSGLTNVKIIDLTFYHLDSGIALASAHCVHGSGRCLALLQTSDGTHWYPRSGDFGFDVRGIKAGCPASKCVDHIRYANDQDGYAYGPDAFFVTTDGGNLWKKESGGAEALETLNDNVIRVSANHGGSCSPGCSYTVQTAGIGSPTWATVSLPGGRPVGAGVQLSRSKHGAYLLLTQNPVGGADDAQSTLYSSADDGSRWTRSSGDPCPQSGGEVDSYQVSAGSEEAVSVLCRERDSGPYRLAVSADLGANFRYVTGTIAYADVSQTAGVDSGGAAPNVLAEQQSTLLAVAGRGVFISRDGGVSWHKSPDLVGTFGFVGFENNEVGRAVTADGSQIWTTRNAGKTWTRATL